MNDTIAKIKEAFCNNDSAKVRDLLVAHPELRSKINEPLAPFDSPAVVWAKSREMLDVLLDAGADINARSRWWAGGFGILDGASPELAEYAIQRGAVLDAHSAARLGRIDELKRLIAANPALVHARGGDGQTPLHFASTVEIAEFLLNVGANIDARDIDHESTPAQYMIKERQAVARYLVSRGCVTDILMSSALGDLVRVQQHLDADPNRIRMTVSNQYFPKQNPHSGGTIYIWTLGAHKSAHHVARDFGHAEVLRFLMKRSPDELKVAVAAEFGDETLVRQLLSEHPDLIQQLAAEDLGRIANAAQDSNLAAVRLMLRSGWPLDARGQHGATPLHWAAFHGNLELTQLILQNHPPLEATDKDFRGTPLGWAIHGSENGWRLPENNYAGTVEALLHAGAKLPEKAGGTPEVREVLSRHGLVP